MTGMAISEISHHTEDLRLAQQCISGDSSAITLLQHQLDNRVSGILRQRGASTSEAEDIITDLLGDSFVPARNGQPPLLSRYNGKCSLVNWYVVIATHRLVDIKRKSSRIVHGNEERPEQAADPDEAYEHATGRLPADSGLIDLMQQALKHAFSSISPEETVLLHLVHRWGVTQREIAAIWGWHESKISRSLDQIMKKVEAETMMYLRKSDPWLEIQWEDFVALCRVNPDFLLNNQS